MNQARERIRSFAAIIGEIVLDSIKHKWKTTFLVISLDTVNAASKILVVLIIALSVKALGSPEGLVIYGFYIENSTKSIWLIGALIGFVALIGAIAGFFAVYFSRRLGRWANQKAMTDIYKVLSAKPNQAIKSKLKSPSNLNILMTQLPLHNGLAYETVSRLINPLLVMLFAGVALFFQHSFFTVVIFSASLFVLPILFTTSLKIQQNAKLFYGEKSQQMGADISKATVILNYQHGIIPKNKENLDFSKGFLDSFDKNMLANHKTGLIVAILDAFLRPALFIVICSLVFLEEFSTEAAITFLGSLAYLLASSKSALSLLTNLLRFQPQVQQYRSFIKFNSSEEAKHAPGQIDKNPLFKNGSVSILFLDKPLSTLNLAHFLPHLLSYDGDYSENELKSMFFVFSTFRFKTGLTIREQLSGDMVEDKTKEIEWLCKKIGAEENILSLADEFETKLDDRVWEKLSSNSRAALRVIPLALKAPGSTVLLDYQVIKSLSPAVVKIVISLFSHCRLIITTPDDFTTKIPNISYMILNDLNQIKIGDKEWFSNQVKNRQVLLENTIHNENTDLTVY